MKKKMKKIVLIVSIPIIVLIVGFLVFVITNFVAGYRHVRHPDFELDSFSPVWNNTAVELYTKELNDSDIYLREPTLNEIYNILSENWVTFDESIEIPKPDTTITVKEYLDKLNDVYTFYEREDYLVKVNSYLGRTETYSTGITAEQGEDKYLYIAEIRENSLADKLKLDVGAKILEVNGLDAKYWDHNGFWFYTAVDYDGKIKLKVEYNDIIKDVTIKCERFNDSTFTHTSYEEVGKTAILRFSSFREVSIKQVLKDLETAKSHSMTAILFDLRFNTGGEMNSLRNLLTEIMPSVGEVFTTEYKNSVDVFSITRDGKFSDMEVFFLINDESASTSEVLTAVLQEYKPNTLVYGKTPTYGKAVMQSIVPLDANDDYLHYTSAKLYLANGETWNKVGVTPDIILNNDFTLKEELVYTVDAINAR